MKSLQTWIACLTVGLCASCGGSDESASVDESASASSEAPDPAPPTAGVGDSASDALQESVSTQGVRCAYSQVMLNTQASLSYTSEADWECAEARTLLANGIPDHAVGTFPNPNNPTAISEQRVSASFSLSPSLAIGSTVLGGPQGPVGYVLNGVKIDAATAGTCDDSGRNCSLAGGANGAWEIEALGQAHFDFGVDFNNAHVQPDGAYHYHGMPEGFLDNLGADDTSMTMIGWAVDGFPIYARYGYEDPEDAGSAIVAVEGSYQLVQTAPSDRPSTDLYALGTFSADWEYVENSGDLDQCNGRYGVTPEFPGGVYHYYATDSYPYFQRCVRGEL